MELTLIIAIIIVLWWTGALSAARNLLAHGSVMANIEIDHQSQAHEASVIRRESKINVTDAEFLKSQELRVKLAQFRAMREQSFAPQAQAANEKVAKKAAKQAQ